MKPKKDRKWYALSIFLFLGISGTAWFFLKNSTQDKIVSSGILTKENPYFVPMKIHGFSSANIPYLTMNIEDKQVNVKIDLGYEGYLTLPSSVIKKLNAKKFLRRKSSYGLQGRIYEGDVYELKKISTDSMSFFPVPAEEANLEFERDINLAGEEKIVEGDFGRVGWNLFQNFNLLIDCKNSTLALCDSLATLKARGYLVDSFTGASLILDRGLIEFEAQTETGILRCMLDSGSTWNMLNRDLKDLSNNHMVFTPKNADLQPILNPENNNPLTFDPKDLLDVSVFKIGGKEFGPITFNRIKSPLAIDAIIGMEFFEDNLVFIDFSKNKIYFFEHPEEEKTVKFAANQGTTQGNS